MAAKENDNMTASRALGEMRVAGDALPGWSNISHLREPFFLKALAMNTFFGLIVGGLYFCYHRNLISFEFKDFHVFSTYIVVLGGGLYLHGELTVRRFLLLLFAAVPAQLWMFFFWDDFPLNLLNIPIGGWIIFWWVWTQPELMEKFGLRKKSLGRDLLISSVLSVVIIAYVLPLLMAYDFRFTVKTRDLLTFMSGVISQNTMNYCVMFSVWNTLDRRGISQLGGLTAIAAMVFAQQGFTWLELGMNGVLSLPLLLGAMIAIILLFVLTFGLAFRMFRNTLPAVFVMTTTQVCMVLIGFMK